MQPSLPVPTDNIYKFSCLFGLVLIVSGIFAFVTSYTASLDRKVKYFEVILPLEAKSERTKAEESLLEMNKKLVDVTKSNELAADVLIAVVLVAGSTLSIFGASKWHLVYQRRDDEIADLQRRKLLAEVSQLESERG